MSRDERHDESTELPEEQQQASVRRPGPHGAAAEQASDDEMLLRAHRKAEKSSRRAFQEVSPQPVTAAEAVTALDEEFELAQADSKGRKPLSKSRACFIATAAYGDIDAPEVEQLRRFRDERLLTNPLGTALVRLYYRVSPPLARLVARSPRLRDAVRRTLDRFRGRAAL